jgi:hypothetical protein
MTVSAVGDFGITWVQTPGNGVATVYNFPFLIFAATDLEVGFITAGVYAPIETGFTVSGIGNVGGGQVTFAVAPALGTTVDIRSLIPETQPTNFSNLGAYYPDSTTQAMDRTVRLITDLARLSYQFGIHGPDTENTTWPALPNAAARAGTGLVFDANGLPSVGAIPTTVFTQTLFNAFLATSALYPQTSAELVAGVTPVNLTYLPGIVDRYGTNTPGTDMTQAIKNSLLQHLQGGAPVQFLPAVYLITSTALKLTNNSTPVTIVGTPLRSVILNKAPASNPSIQLIDSQYFDISGLVFVGRATFPNIGIDLTGANGGQRTAFGRLHEIVAQTNGGGVHIAGANTVTIDNYQYWPSGGSSFAGGATIDANGQPYGILADTVGVAGFNEGAVNSVYLRNINVGAVNTIANGGCAVKIDGSASAAPFQDWLIQGLEAENPANGRSLWVRNVNLGSFEHLFVENTEVRIDQNCVRVSVEHLEGAATATVVVDGTQSLGACSQIKFDNCQASSITADAANTLSTHISCAWTGATGDADLSIGKSVFNSRGAGSTGLPDRLGKAGLALAQTSGIVTLVNGSTVDVVSQTVARCNSAGNVTGIVLNTPSVNAGAARMAVIQNVGSGSFTMAAAGTSNVANGVAIVIPGGNSRTFFWDATSALWYTTA